MSADADAQALMLSKRLSEAIHNNNTEQVRDFIKQGVDLTLQNEFYSERYSSSNHVVPLALACCLGREEIMEELLKAGANPNHTSGRFDTPVMTMTAGEHTVTLSMVKSLIEYGANVTRMDCGGNTILHWLACYKSNDTDNHILSVVKLLLDNGASFYARDDDYHTPLSDACMYGNIKLVKLFITEGADVNFDNGLMLEEAVKSGNIDMFDFLLEAGAHRRLEASALMSPCSQNNNAMIVRILNTCDMDINSEIVESCATILHYACSSSRLGVNSGTLKLLLENGADVRAVSDTRDTALHCTVSAYDCDCSKIRHLLSYSPPLNMRNNKNQTPLVSLVEVINAGYRTVYNPPRVFAAWYRIRVIAFRMLVIAGAKITDDLKHELNELHIKYPETQISDFETSFTRSLKEMCRFVICETLPVSVRASIHELIIPKSLQEYLTFPEFSPLVDEYVMLSRELVP